MPDESLFTCECAPPWLIARFAAPQRIVSWSLNRPGFVDADTVAWLQVRTADLPLEVDPLRFLEARLAERDLERVVGLMTARDVRQHHVDVAGDGDARVATLVTLGLSNGVSIDDWTHGTATASGSMAGTINLLVAVARPLADAALLETVSIAATARTAALLADGGRIAGTGTDCIAIACTREPGGAAFAGLHTAIGRQVAGSVYRATRHARAVWAAGVSLDSST